MSGKDQGTGKHGHKDTEEPWPHHGQSGSQGSDHESRPQEGGSGSQGRGGGESGSRGEEQSLKEREYRDKEGNIHHHTKTYEEQHGKK